MSQSSEAVGESDPVIRRALLSVSDKSGLVEFARFLHQQGVELLSTGGSAKAMIDAGLPVVEVSAHTGFPEIMDGRVKTLHPKIHGGILARRDLESHRAAMQEHGIAPIDLLVSNLYPFEATIARGADFDEAIENIDVGGPAMVRAAAKNHASVAVVTDPGDYEPVMKMMRENAGALSEDIRRRLAATAFAHTAAYDSMISRWFAEQNGERFPDRLTLAGRLQAVLRYGENPHQEAAFYTTADARPGIATARQLQGKALSYNNLNDTNAAIELVAEFSEPSIAIIKHANPCGVASAPNLQAAYAKALACDPVSAFGGIIAMNRPLDAVTAQEIAKLFVEVIVAPDIDPAAADIISAKANLRLLVTDRLPDPGAEGLVLAPVSGGFLAQTRDNGQLDPATLSCVTKRQPSEQEMADLIFAFRVAKHVKSNAIIYARDGATVGVGAGQMSRVDSARIAARKAEDAAEAAGQSQPLTKGSVVASDAFFPFADGLLTAAAAGATAVIQPGGSLRDEEVIAAADEAGLAMVFTGMRHFRH